MREFIIVGAGVGGAGAALALAGRDVLLLDVGRELTTTGSASELRAAQRRNPERLDQELIGEHFESVLQPSQRHLSVKLKAPRMRQIMERVTPDDSEEDFHSIQSFTKGGLANAWGAGLMRYTAEELAQFPLSVCELEPIFDLLTKHIGISGSTSDDLARYFGSTSSLLPELALSKLGERFLQRYTGRREFLNNSGIWVGRPRLGVLTADHRGRERFTDYGAEFFTPLNRGIYSPAFTIDELIDSGKLTYQSGILVKTFHDYGDYVEVKAQDLLSGEEVVFQAKQLILAAGTLNSARIVLASRKDYSTRLTLLDNPVSFLPLIDFGRIGVKLSPDSYLGAELCLVFRSSTSALPIQGSLYNLLGPLRTDLIKEYPLLFKDNLIAGRELTPALLMLQLFYPDLPHSENYLQLQPNGGLTLHRGAARPKGVEGKLCRALLRLGYGAFEFLAKRPPAGSSIHYAGTFPMRATPKTSYEVDSNCRFSWAPRVTLADASTFPVLPAKNHSFMLMANAYRVAQLHHCP